MSVAEVIHPIIDWWRCDGGISACVDELRVHVSHLHGLINDVSQCVISTWLLLMIFIRHVDVNFLQLVNDVTLLIQLQKSLNDAPNNREPGCRIRNRKHTLVC